MERKLLPPASVGLVAFALALSCSPQAAVAVATTPGSPIQISSCTVLQWNRTYARPYIGPYWYPGPVVVARGAPETDGISISYVNRGPIAADRVQFEVDYRGQRDRIVDVGTFSPNVTINHNFGNFSGLAYLGSRPNYCRVRRARFVDGTVWRSPIKEPARM